MLTEIPLEVTTPDVVLHWFHYALYIALDFALAFRVACLLKSNCPKLLTEKFLAILLIVSSGFLLLAGIGRVGWSIQTWGSKTPPENLDRMFFLCLSYIGGFLLFTYLILILKKEDN